MKLKLGISAALLLLVQCAAGDDAAGATATTTTTTGGQTLPPPSPSAGGAYNYPPPPGPVGGGGGFPGGFPLFPGFYKNFDFNAGFSPFGGLGGLGGIPGGLGGLGALGGLGGLGGLLGGGGPPPLDEFDGGPPPDGGVGGPFGGFGGFGPSYIPSTWIGSALGAKGDLLFPIVIFVFFVVGVWTVIQLLLGFIVPLIAKKIAIKGALFRRAAPDQTTTDLDFITNAVMDAINEPKCLQYVACHSGNFLNSMAGGKEAVKNYEGILKSLASMAESDTLTLFENAFVSGETDCSKYTCDRSNDSPAAPQAKQPAAAPSHPNDV